MYAPGVEAVPGLNVEQCFSICDFRSPGVYASEELLGREVGNRESYRKSSDAVTCGV